MAGFMLPGFNPTTGTIGPLSSGLQSLTAYAAPAPWNGRNSPIQEGTPFLPTGNDPSVPPDLGNVGNLLPPIGITDPNNPSASDSGPDYPILGAIIGYDIWGNPIYAGGNPPPSNGGNTQGGITTTGAAPPIGTPLPGAGSPRGGLTTSGPPRGAVGTIPTSSTPGPVSTTGSLPPGIGGGGTISSPVRTGATGVPYGPPDGSINYWGTLPPVGPTYTGTIPPPTVPVGGPVGPTYTQGPPPSPIPTGMQYFGPPVIPPTDGGTITGAPPPTIPPVGGVPPVGGGGGTPPSTGIPGGAGGLLGLFLHLLTPHIPPTPIPNALPGQMRNQDQLTQQTDLASAPFQDYGNISSMFL